MKANEGKAGGEFRREGGMLVWVAGKPWSGHGGMCLKVALDGDEMLVEVAKDGRRSWVPAAKALTEAEAARWLRECGFEGMPAEVVRKKELTGLGRWRKDSKSATRAKARRAEPEKKVTVTVRKHRKIERDG